MCFCLPKKLSNLLLRKTFTPESRKCQEKWGYGRGYGPHVSGQKRIAYDKWGDIK